MFFLFVKYIVNSMEPVLEAQQELRWRDDVGRSRVVQSLGWSNRRLQLRGGHGTGQTVFFFVKCQKK
jgi:hypothetical protein